MFNNKIVDLMAVYQQNFGWFNDRCIRNVNF